MNNCNACGENTTRVYIKYNQFTDSDFDSIKSVLIENGKFIEIQAEGTIQSIKMQRQFLRSKLISSVSDSLIFSGDASTAKAITDALSVKEIQSYIKSPKNFIK